MKIRLRLSLLSLGTTFFFLGGIAIYFVILLPLNAMKNENKYFLELSRAAANLQIESNKLVLINFSDQGTNYTDAVNRFFSANDDLSKVVLLPKVNKEISEAFEAMKNVRPLSEDFLNSITDDFAQIKTFTQKIFQNSDMIDFSQLSRNLYSTPGDQAAEGLYYTDKLQRDLVSLNESLTVTRKIIDEKDRYINLEMAKIEGASTLTAMMIIAVGVLASLVVSLSMASRLANALTLIARRLSAIREGDLTIRMGVRRKDEIGKLSSDMDGLLERLNQAFRQIQESSAQNLKMKDALISAVSTTTSSSVQIEANSDSILRQMERMDQMLKAAAEEIASIAQSIESFHSRMGVQNHQVEESTKAVETMIGAIEGISAGAEDNQRSVQELVQESDRGKEIFERSFGKVAEITESVAGIQDLVEVIKEIASQTNILALNAAIEAAHAGEFGKGFAVVADEISKLAAESAESSAQIQTTIKDMVTKIGEAGSTKDESIQAFQGVSDKIRTVSASVSAIHQNALNLALGSRQIQENIRVLEQSSVQNTRESDRINTAASSIRETMDSVERISHEVVSNIGEISLGLKEITTTVRDVSVHAEQAGEIGKNLDGAVNSFRTVVQEENETGD